MQNQSTVRLLIDEGRPDPLPQLTQGDHTEPQGTLMIAKTSLGNEVSMPKVVANFEQGEWDEMKAYERRERRKRFWKNIRWLLLLDIFFGE